MLNDQFNSGDNSMKYKSLILGAVFLVGSFPFAVSGKDCKPTDPKDTNCTLHVDKVRPTQFAVGLVAVKCKAEKIEKKNKKKLKKYLEEPKREIPVVIGPDGNFYMTDHHHLSSALYRANSPKWGKESKKLHLKILDNFYNIKDDTSWGKFWEEMQQKHRSYNYDNKGIPHMSFDLLPSNVGGLLNDPYRTLSRWVRESCGYVKAGKTQCDGIRTDHEHKAPFFMEFYWGNFFRENLPLKIKENITVCKSMPYSATCLDDEVAQLKGIYEQAMKLAASEKAKEYLENNGLDPWEYGFNPSGEHLELTWSGSENACEEVVTQ
ncbi:MAG: hypothetical protein D3913_05130 [Candidatus Electrothrix sp. LOE1_4_5]|nr:hypothetical protein [Candidatus Electrothrix gigas]